MKYSKILEKYKKYFNNKLYKEQNILGVINLLNEEDLKYIKNFINVKNYDSEIINQIKKDKILFNNFSQLSEEKKELFYIFYKNFKFSSKKKNNIITNIKEEKKRLNEKLNQITVFFNLNLKVENLNFNINDRKNFEKNIKILEVIQKKLNELKLIIEKYRNFNSISKEEKENLNNQLKEKIKNIESYLNQIYSDNIKINYEDFQNKIFNITNKEKIINEKVIKDINNILKDINLNENIENFNKILDNYEEFIEQSKEKIIVETVKEIINQKFYLKLKDETTEITQNKINEFFKQKLNIDIKNNISLQEILKNAIEVKTSELIDKIDNSDISVKEEMKHIIKNIENINLSEIIKEIISNIEENNNIKINKNIKNEINLFLRKEIILKTFIDKYPLISMENLKNIEKMENILNSQNRITLYEKELLKSVINDFKNIENDRKTVKRKTKNKEKRNKILYIIDKSLNNFIAKENNNEVIDKIIKEINLSLLDSNIDIKSENEIFNEIIKKYKIDEKNINLINKIKIEIQNYIKKRESLLLNELNDNKNTNNYEIIKEEFIQNINNLINNEKIDSIYKLKKEFINNVKKNKNVSLEELLKNIVLETLLNETPNIYSKIQSEFIKNNSFEFLSKEEKIEKLKILLNKEIKLLLDEKIKQKIQKNILQTMKELKPIIEKTNIYYVMNDEKILKKSKTENQFYNLLSEKVSSFFIEDSYLSNLINLNIEEPLKNVLVNKQNIFNKNEKLNIGKALNDKTNSQIEEEIKNYITKTLFLKKRYKNINEIYIVKETNNEKEVKKLINKIYKKVITEIENQKFIDENLIHIIKDKTLEILNNEKNEKISLNNDVKKEIKNNITAVTKPIKRLEIEKNIFQKILNLMQNLEIARKSNNKYWEKEINNDLILILENNENLIIEYAKENKILSKILKNENLSKNKIDEVIKYLKNNIQNNNEKSFNKNFQIFLQLFDKNKIEKNINKIEEVIDHKNYFFNEKNNFLLKNINNLLIDYYLKKEKTKEAKILKKLYSNYKNYNNQNIKIDEYFKNNFSLLDEESKTKFYFGDFNISYDKFIKKEEKKLKEQNFQTSLKHKTKLSDYTEIYFQFLSNLKNDEIINEVIKILKENTLSETNDDFEQLNKIGEILKKSLIVKYNTENEFLLNIENNMLKNVKDEEVKEKIKKGFEHFLTNSINEEINNLSKMEYLTDERIDISVQNIINTIKERLTNKNLKAIKIDDELIKLSDYQNIIGDLDYEKLRKHLFFVLKNSSNLKLKYNTLKVEGVNSSKFKKELIKLKKEKILKEDLENFKKTKKEEDLKNLKNYIENIIINELATNKNKIVKLKEELSYIKNKEESKNEILSKITDEIIENFVRTNKINTSELGIDLKTILKNKILSENDDLKNHAKNILEYYYNNESNINYEEIQKKYFNKLFNENDGKIPRNFEALIEFYQYFKNYVEEKKENNFQQEIYNSERRKKEILEELLKKYLKNNGKQILLNSFSTIDFENLYSNGYTITIKNQKEILEEILNYLNLENLETEFESNLNANKILLNFKLEIKKGENTKNIELPIKLLKEDILNNLLNYLEEELKEEKDLSNFDNSSKYNKLLKNEIKKNLKIYQEISKEKNKIYKKHEKNLIAEKYDNNNEKIINLLNKFNIDKHLINNYEIINDFEHFNKSLSILSSFDELNGIFYSFKNLNTNISSKKIKEELKTLKKANIILNNSNVEEQKLEFNFQKEYLKKESLLNIDDNSFFLLKEKLKDYIFLKELKYLDEKQKLNSDEYKFLNSFQTNIDFFYFKNKKIEKIKNKEKKEELKRNNESNFLNSFLYNKEMFKQIQNLDNNNEKQKLKTKLKIIDNLITSSFINFKFSKNENLNLKTEILSIELNLEYFKQNIYNNTNISIDEKNKKLDEIFKIFVDLTKEEEYKEYFKEINKFITLLENPNKLNKKELLKIFEKKLLENELKEKIIFLKTIFNSNENLISEQKKEKLDKFITNITLLDFDKLNENQLEIYKIEINNNIENLIDELKLQEINISKEEIILNSIKKERKKEDIRFQNELKKEFISLLKDIQNEKFNEKIKTNLINFIQLAGNDFKFNFTVIFKKLINKQIEEIEQKIKQIKNKIGKVEEIKELEKKLENLKNILLNTQNINETVFLKYLESIDDNEFIYKNLFDTKIIENLSKEELDQKFENTELEKLLNSFFSENDIVAKKIDYVTNNVYSKKEGLYFLDIKGNSLNESSKEQYLNLNNLLLNNNIEILTWMKENLTEKNEFYNKFNTVLEDDESTKWIIYEGQNDELNKYEKTNIYYLLENEKRIKLKKEKLNQILNEVEKQKISFELIDEETNEIKKLDIKIVDFFEMNNDSDEKLNFQKFKNYIVKKIGNLSIDEEISNEVIKELENEGLTEENHEIYWNEYKNKYKYKLEEKYKNLKEKEKNGENIKEELEKIEKNIKEISKIDNLSIDFDKLYSFYEQYHKIKKEFLRISNVEKKLEEKISDPTIIALIEFQILPEMIKNGYPEDIIRNMKQRIKKEKMKTDNIYRYSSIKNFETIEEAKKKLIEEINFLEENMGQSDGITKEKYNKRLTNLKKLYEEIETITMEGNVLDEDYIDKLNEKFKILLNENSIIKMHQLSRKVKKGAVEVTKETFNFANAIFRTIGNQYGFGVLLNEAFHAIVPKNPLNKKRTNEENINNERHQLNKRIYEEIKGHETTNEIQHSNFELN